MNLKKILAICWAFLLFAVLYFYFKFGISIKNLQDFVGSFGFWSPLIFIIAYAIRPLVFFPSSIMTSLSAVLFGPILGWAFAFVGENISATIAFLLARYFGRQFIKEKESLFLKEYDKKLQRCGFETVLMFRLLPAFPFDFVNYASGLSSVRYTSYIFATLLGIIPGLTAYIFLGTSLMKPVLLIPTIILLVGISLFAHSKHKKINC